jgi:Trypsin
MITFQLQILFTFFLCSLFSQVGSGAMSIPSSNQFQFLVGVFSDQGRFCTGALIDADTVLAPRHCLFHTDELTYVMFNMTNVDLKDGIRSNIVMTFYHPNDNGFPGPYDIGILKLETSAPSSLPFLELLTGIHYITNVLMLLWLDGE